MVSNVLVHSKHVHLGLLENGLHLFVAQDLALVLGVLKLICFDVFPQLLDHLWARKLDMFALAGCLQRASLRQRHLATTAKDSDKDCTHTWVSPVSSERAGLRLKGFIKPPPAFLFLTTPSPDSTSLSSLASTFLELFLRGAAFCFLDALALALSPPPRVLRLRAKLFSWACSWAAKRASASSTDDERLAFFLAGSGDAERSVSPASEVAWLADLLIGAGSGSGADAPEKASKRASMSFLMAAW